eukprot:Amastigsp_a508336_320.p1 type:complete len:190 gc:universal Amastigsp_a508336_320:206-775(+)
MRRMIRALLFLVMETALELARREAEHERNRKVLLRRKVSAENLVEHGDPCSVLVAAVARERGLDALDGCMQLDVVRLERVRIATPRELAEKRKQHRLFNRVMMMQRRRQRGKVPPERRRRGSGFGSSNQCLGSLEEPIVEMKKHQSHVPASVWVLSPLASLCCARHACTCWSTVSTSYCGRWSESLRTE